MQFEESATFDGRFLLREYIGSGSYGEVWLAHDTQTDIDVAVKVYVAMDSKGLEDFKKEFKVSFDLNHTNLLHAYFLEVSKEEQRPYLVMPYCPYGSAMKNIGKMSEEELWKYIKDVSSGLAYLHSQDPPIIHQDIKPDNILVSKNRDYVITDFGISQQARSTLRRSKQHMESAGSMAYMGPERFGKQYNAIKASDIWSLGVTIYELAVGDLPFCGLGGSMLRQGADLPELPSDRFSSELNAVMQSCLAKETWERPTAEMLEEYAISVLSGRKIPVPWFNKPEKENSQNDPLEPTVPDSSETDNSFDRTRIIGTAAEEGPENPSETVIGDGSRPLKWYVWLLAAIGGFAAGAVIYFLNIF